MQEFMNSVTNQGNANQIVISIPLEGHTGASLRNLINLLYSRAPLLSRATGGFFEVKKQLIESLDTKGTLSTPEAFREFLEDNKGDGVLYGVRILEDRIDFTGFRVNQDVAHTKAYVALAAQLNQMALKQKRILAKEPNIENEKYAMHILLIRLGMNGPYFKEERKILMERLSGSQAFRTPDQMERAKIKNAQKRRALKEQRTETDKDIANC